MPPTLHSWYSQKQIKLIFATLITLTLLVGTLSFASPTGSNQLLSSNQQSFESSQTGWEPQGNTTVFQEVFAGQSGSGALLIRVDEKGPWPDNSKTARAGTLQYSRGIKVSAGDALVGSIFVRGFDGSAGQARCEIREYADNQILSTHTTTSLIDVGPSWSQLNCEAKLGPNAKQVALRVFISDADYGEKFLADNASLAKTGSQPPVTQPPTTQAPTTTQPSETQPPVTQPPTDDANGNKSGSEFVETFTGTPSSPKSLVMNYPRWSMYPVSQGSFSWVLNPDPMIAQHGPNCEKPEDFGYRGWDGKIVPSGFHKLTSLDDTVYQCANHVMTASNPQRGGTGNDMVVMKPNHMVDLTKGVATISVDVSTLGTSIGSWWDMWITPWDNQLLHPTEHPIHFSGRPKGALQSQIRDFDNLGQSKKWLFQAYDNNYRPLIAENTQPNGFDITFDKGAPDIRSFVGISTTRRDTYEMRIDKANSTVQLFIRAVSDNELKLIKTHKVPGGINFDYGVVQFLSANYNPTTNAANPNCAHPCRIPTTWHWDNAVIKPAVPYTLINANQRLIWDDSPSKKITWDEAAPANARMLFIANSDSYVSTDRPELSFDGGATWKKAQWVRPTNDGGVFTPRFDMLTYSIDVPHGQREALIRGKNYDSKTQIGKWAAQNFQIVAK